VTNSLSVVSKAMPVLGLINDVFYDVISWI